METFLKKLDRVLRSEFQGATTELQRWEPPRWAGGFLVWKGFLGMDPRDRVKRIYDALRERLAEKDMQRVGLIMPMTPLEMQVRKDELEREEEAIRRSLRKTRSS